jgi:hypothetical protein
MRTRALLSASIICTVLSMVTWDDAFGFHFEDYYVYEGSFLGCDMEPYLGYREYVQLNESQSGSYFGSQDDPGCGCASSSFDSYIEAGLLSFSVSQHFEGTKSSCTATCPYGIRAYCRDGGSGIFRTVIRSDPGDAPTCTLTCQVDNAGYTSGDDSLGAYHMVFVWVNSEIIAGIGNWCGWEGGFCGYSADTAVVVRSGDVVTYDIDFVQASGNALSGNAWVDINVDANLVGLANASVVDNQFEISGNSHCLMNSPNPFRIETSIEFDLPTRQHAVVRVFAATGQQITTLCNGLVRSGHHELIWNGKDSMGTEVPPGIYFCHLEANGLSRTRKMLLLE